MEEFGPEFICPYYERPDQHTLAKWLLFQSGALKEFGPLEQGDQIEILSMQVNVTGIKIVARFGNMEKEFYLKAKQKKKKKKKKNYPSWLACKKKKKKKIVLLHGSQIVRSTMREKNLNVVS